ncbi:MAG: hypothetical protein BRD55_01335 [Bacteroidetes bacterium SW_9_63_38]|nr:MAG: hypothetical protein BRD55_01335 [Bacteroidetes bacterium SW_9_63_38]
MSDQQDNASAQDLPTEAGTGEGDVIWKPAPPPFEDTYLVSEEGQVVSLHGERPTLLTPTRHRKRTKHRRIGLNRDGKEEKWLVHRLIWHSHRGPIPSKMVVHHTNGDPTDNRLNNLEILSLSEHTTRHNRAVAT